MGFAKLLGIHVNRRRDHSIHDLFINLFLVKKEEFNVFREMCILVGKNELIWSGFTLCFL